MRKGFLLLAAAMLSLAASAVERDTVRIEKSRVTKFVSEQKTSAKGRVYTKHYAIIDGQLADVSKSVREKMEACAKFGVKCRLAVVRDKSTKSIIRLIVY